MENDLLDKGRSLALGIPRDQWRVVMREMVCHLTEPRRADLQRYIRQARAEDKRSLAADIWFEEYYQVNPAAQPKVATTIYRHYHRIDRTMHGFFHQIARRVKNRLQTRAIRAMRGRDGE